MLAISVLDVNVQAVLFVIAFIVAVVVAVVDRSLLAVAVALATFVLAWNTLALT